VTPGDSQPHLIGLLLGLFVVVAIASTVYWMLHPPTTVAERAARETERDIEDIVGSIIVVFSSDIHSEHMMALAARLAQKERAQLLAAYIIEVPLTLPVGAEMEVERRAALGVLATAEAIARQRNVEIETEVIPARQVSQGVLDLAKKRDAHLIVVGAYREGKYSGANAACDVIIGVQGHKGKILAQKSPSMPKVNVEEVTY
jgi:nucleotide-binding universal stress UspA family protein